VAERTSVCDAVRQAIRSDVDLAALSPQESAMLAGHLTQLVARVERVRALGPAYAGIEVSRDVQELLVRLEVGSSLETGVH
jgi:hypothetical protein